MLESAFKAYVILTSLSEDGCFKKQKRIVWIFIFPRPYLLCFKTITTLFNSIQHVEHVGLEQKFNPFWGVFGAHDFEQALGSRCALFSIITFSSRLALCCLFEI